MMLEEHEEDVDNDLEVREQNAEEDVTMWSMTHDEEDNDDDDD